jgi:hypothetical protein
MEKLSLLLPDTPYISCFSRSLAPPPEIPLKGRETWGSFCRLQPIGVIMFKHIKELVRAVSPTLVDKYNICRCYHQQFGRLPSISNPKTFSEFVQWRKIYERDIRMSVRTDKIAAKEIVSGALDSSWVIPTLWHGAKLPAQSERNWPLPFVIKASHGSAMNYFVRTQAEADWSKIEALCESWLAIKYYGDWNAHWAYSKVPPRLLVEPFIGELGELPLDYKFWMFHGKVAFIQVDVGREHNHKRTMFDKNWNRLPFGMLYPVYEGDIRPPSSLKQMIRAAELLSRDFTFVRVDLYEISGSPKFGELTFYPEEGLTPFDPPEWDLRFGHMWLDRSNPASVGTGVELMPHTYASIERTDAAENSLPLTLR